MNKEIHENIIETEKILLNINEVDAIEYSIWTKEKEKAKLKYNGIIPNFPIYNNFIYWCNLGINIRSEQNKIRPVIIVGSTIKSPIAIIIQLTSKRLKDEFWVSH